MDLKKISLDIWRTSYAADLADALNSRKVQDNLRDGIPYPYQPQDAKNYIDKILTAGEDSVYAFAVMLSGKVIGSISVTRKDNVHRYTGELGYFIAEKWWGRGIATEAVKKMCEFIFSKTNIMRIYAEPYATNEASCRVLAKAGFTLEGVLRNNAFKNGKLIDTRIYSLVRTNV